MKQLISRRSFMKAAGVTTAVAAVSLGAPAASACFPGSVKDITILYTNDVHTYIDKKSPELTYAAIAALKKSYQDAGKDVLLVDAGDHIQGTAYGSMDEGASIIQLMNAAGYDVATPGNHDSTTAWPVQKRRWPRQISRTSPATGSICRWAIAFCRMSSTLPSAAA